MITDRPLRHRNDRHPSTSGPYILTNGVSLSAADTLIEATTPTGALEAALESDPVSLY